MGRSSAANCQCVSIGENLGLMAAAFTTPTAFIAPLVPGMKRRGKVGHASSRFIERPALLGPFVKMEGSDDDAKDYGKGD
jgi:hypothetical protein